MVLFEILASVILISLLSLVGVVTLTLGEKRLGEFLPIFIAFASGSLLAAAFLDLIPEALEKAGVIALSMVLVGVILFFIVERFIHWHHCGKEECHVKPVAYLSLFGDGVHNFMDGVVVAAAYMTSTHLGIITTIVIALHEIPQEFGDFSVLIHSGMKARKALLYNFISALAAVFGGVAGFVFLTTIESWIPLVVATAAGGLIYIATADLMPELHKETQRSKLVLQTIALFAGILILFVLFNVLPKA